MAPIEYTFTLTAADILKKIGYKRMVIPLGLTYQRNVNPLPADAYIDQYKYWYMAPPAPTDENQVLTCVSLTNTITIGGDPVTATNGQYVFDRLDEVVIETDLVHTCQNNDIQLS